MIDYFTISPTYIIFNHSTICLIIIIFLLLAISITLILQSKILYNILSLSVFSALISFCYLLMDAADVAMTEISLGACLSTAIILKSLNRINHKSSNIDKNEVVKVSLALILISALIFSLIYFGHNIEVYGSSKTLLHNNINQYYLKNTAQDIGINSFVAALLAGYRGYDTLGETAVILLAGIAIIFIIGAAKKQESSNAKIKQN